MIVLFFKCRVETEQAEGLISGLYCKGYVPTDRLPQSHVRYPLSCQIDKIN